MTAQTPAHVLLCPPSAKTAKDDNSFRCRTVGELLVSSPACATTEMPKRPGSSLLSFSCRNGRTGVGPAGSASNPQSDSSIAIRVLSSTRPGPYTASTPPVPCRGGAARLLIPNVAAHLDFWSELMVPRNPVADALQCPPSEISAEGGKVFRYGTVGELLASIACLLHDGDTDNAWYVILACGEMYADFPLPPRSLPD